MKPLVCGIDLGTTNSVIAYLRDGIPTAIPVEEGTAILPSVVSFVPKQATGGWGGRPGTVGRRFPGIPSRPSRG